MNTSYYISTACFFRVVLLVIATFSSSALLAEVYQTVDKEGNAIFSDVKPEGESKKIVIEPVNVMPAHEGNGDEFVFAEEAPEVIAPTIRITSPAHEATIRNPAEPIVVSVETIAASNLLVQIFLDGKLVSSGKKSYALTTFERGEHFFEAKLFNEETKSVVAHSDKVTIFIHRTSVSQNKASQYNQQLAARKAAQQAAQSGLAARLALKLGPLSLGAKAQAK